MRSHHLRGVGVTVAFALIALGCHAFTGSDTTSPGTSDAGTVGISPEGGSGHDAGPGSAVCLPALPNMIGWWAADGNMQDHFAASPGVAGNANGIGYSEGKVDRAFDLGGTQFVSVANTSASTVATAVTVEAWIYPTSLEGTIASKADAPSATGFGLSLVSGHAQFALGNLLMLSSVSVTPNEWTHVAGTTDGQVMSVYVNGQPSGKGGATMSTVATTQPLTIGANAQGSAPFTGRIDELVLYDRALDPAEIQAIFRAGPLGHCKQ